MTQLQPPSNRSQARASYSVAHEEVRRVCLQVLSGPAIIVALQQQAMNDRTVALMHLDYTDFIDYSFALCTVLFS